MFGFIIRIAACMLGIDPQNAVPLCISAWTVAILYLASPSSSYSSGLLSIAVLLAMVDLLTWVHVARSLPPPKSTATRDLQRFIASIHRQQKSSLKALRESEERGRQEKFRADHAEAESKRLFTLAANAEAKVVKVKSSKKQAKDELDKANERTRQAEDERDNLREQAHQAQTEAAVKTTELKAAQEHNKRLENEVELAWQMPPCSLMQKGACDYCSGCGCGCQQQPSVPGDTQPIASSPSAGQEEVLELEEGESSQEELTHLRQDNENLRTSLESVDSQKAALTEEVAGLRSKVTDQEKTIDQQEMEIEKASKAWGEAEAGVIVEKDRAEACEAEAKRQSKELSAAYQARSDAEAAAETQAQNLQSQIQSQQSTLDTTQENLRQVTGERDILLVTSAEQETRIETLEREATEEKAVAGQELADAKEESRSWKDKSDAASRASKSLNIRLEDQQSTSRNLGIQLHSSKEEIRVLDKKLKDRQNSHIEVVGKVQGEKRKVQNELTAMTKEASSLAARVKALEDELRQLKEAEPKASVTPTSTPCPERCTHCGIHECSAGTEETAVEATVGPEPEPQPEPESEPATPEDEPAQDAPTPETHPDLAVTADLDEQDGSGAEEPEESSVPSSPPLDQSSVQLDVPGADPQLEDNGNGQAAGPLDESSELQPPPRSSPQPLSSPWIPPLADDASGLESQPDEAALEPQESLQSSKPPSERDAEEPTTEQQDRSSSPLAEPEDSPIAQPSVEAAEDDLDSLFAGSSIAPSECSETEEQDEGSDSERQEQESPLIVPTLGNVEQALDQGAEAPEPTDGAPQQPLAPQTSEMIDEEAEDDTAKTEAPQLDEEVEGPGPDIVPAQSAECMVDQQVEATSASSAPDQQEAIEDPQEPVESPTQSDVETCADTGLAQEEAPKTDGQVQESENLAAPLENSEQVPDRSTQATPSPEVSDQHSAPPTSVQPGQDSALADQESHGTVDMRAEDMEPAPEGPAQAPSSSDPPVEEEPAHTPEEQASIISQLAPSAPEPSDAGTMPVVLDSSSQVEAKDNDTLEEETAQDADPAATEATSPEIKPGRLVLKPSEPTVQPATIPLSQPSAEPEKQAETKNLDEMEGVEQYSPGRSMAEAEPSIEADEQMEGVDVPSPTQQQVATGSPREQGSDEMDGLEETGAESEDLMDFGPEQPSYRPDNAPQAESGDQMEVVDEPRSSTFQVPSLEFQGLPTVPRTPMLFGPPLEPAQPMPRFHAPSADTFRFAADATLHRTAQSVAIPPPWSSNIRFQLPPQPVDQTSSQLQPRGDVQPPSQAQAQARDSWSTESLQQFGSSLYGAHLPNDGSVQRALPGLGNLPYQPPVRTTTPPDQIMGDPTTPPGAPGGPGRQSEDDEMTDDQIDQENAEFYGETDASAQSPTSVNPELSNPAPQPQSSRNPPTDPAPAAQPAPISHGTSSKRKRQISEGEQPQDSRAPKRAETEESRRDNLTAPDVVPLSEAPQAPPQASEPLPARPVVQPRPRGPGIVPFAPAQTEQQQQLNERSAAQSRELIFHDLGDDQPHHAEQRPKRLNDQDVEFRARSGDQTEELGWDPRVKLPGMSAERVWDRTLAERRPDVFQERPEDGPAFADATLFDTEGANQADRDAAEARQAGLDARRARDEARFADEEDWDADRLLRDVDEENDYLYGPSDSAFTQAPPASAPSTSQAAHPPTTRGNKRGFNGETIPNPSAPSASTTLREPHPTRPQTLISPNSPPESRPSSSSSESGTDQHKLPFHRRRRSDCEASLGDDDDDYKVTYPSEDELELSFDDDDQLGYYSGEEDDAEFGFSDDEKDGAAADHEDTAMDTREDDAADNKELSDADRDGDELMDDGPPGSDADRAEREAEERRTNEHDFECHELLVAADDGVCVRENCPWCPGADGKGGWQRREMNG
ncbi:MAG: hypothetical protein Q9202_003431 [Teloschistes flavicans]